MVWLIIIATVAVYVAYKATVAKNKKAFGDDYGENYEKSERATESDALKKETKREFASLGWKLAAPSATDRMRRARNEQMQVVGYDKANDAFEISAASGAIYYTSGRGCTCPDYQNRGGTCKHIFFLAHKLCTETVKAYMPFGGYVSPSGGYTSFAKYKVTGTNPLSGRKKSCTCTARSETFAGYIASAEGLVEPFEFQALPAESPTDRQLDYLNKLGSSFPNGANAFDVSAIIARISDGDSTVPTESLSAYAFNNGVEFSKYTGECALISRIVGSFGDAQLWMFYFYCVFAKNNNSRIGNVEAMPFYDVLQAYVNKNLAVLGAPPRDPGVYIKPLKSAAEYKKATAFLQVLNNTPPNNP